MDLIRKINLCSVTVQPVTYRSREGQTRKITSLVEAAGPTLCVFLPAMSASFSPEPYRAKGCLLSSVGCRAGAGRTRWERQVCFEDLDLLLGLVCCGPPMSLSTNRKDKCVKAEQKLKAVNELCLIIRVDSNAHTVNLLEKEKQSSDEVAVNIYESRLILFIFNQLSHFVFLVPHLEECKYVFYLRKEASHLKYCIFKQNS